MHIYSIYFDFLLIHVVFIAHKRTKMEYLLHKDRLLDKWLNRN